MSRPKPSRLRFHYAWIIVGTGNFIGYLLAVLLCAPLPEKSNPASSSF